MTVGLVGCAGSNSLAGIHNERIGSLHGQKKKRHGHSPIVKMSVNRASTISGVALCIIHGLCYGFYP